MLPKKLRNWKVLIGAAFLLACVGIAGLTYLRAPKSTPVMRGHALARKLGCFACHGPGGTGGVPNPGSDEGEVPAWDGGVAMMYIETEPEIREWILYGAPRRLWKGGKKPSGHEHGQQKKQSDGHAADQPAAGEHAHGEGGHHGKGDGDEHAGHGDEGHGHLIPMPAYEGLVSESELSDLVTYYKAVAAYDDPPSEKAQKGYEVASQKGCFGCHGPGGRGGPPNPRSFKGYVPPWDGKDFREVVANDDELRAWILDGKIDRFERDPIARHFTSRQIIQMPAYRGRLSAEELEALIAYVHWLRGK